MTALLVCFTALTATAAVDLLVLGRHSESLFAWTVEPPLSAGFLGAGYGAGCVLSALSLLGPRWGWPSSRVPATTIWVFTVLTLITSLLGLDRFHFTAAQLSARVAAWVWLSVYVVVPVALGAVLLASHVQPGERDQRGRRGTRSPMPRWLALPLALEGLVLLVVGVALLLVPGRVGVLWPWSLTPLTARMAGSWLVAFGLAAGLCLWEADLGRLRSSTVAFTAFGLLELTALVGYGGDTVPWSTPASVVYTVGLVLVVATGTAGFLMSGRHNPICPAQESR